jgi:transcriptional regulator with XRE-family HTH domain
MPRNANLVGPNVIKLRHQHGWTQDQLVSKLNLLGYYFTRDIVANIESRRSVVSDVQIRALAEAFGVDEGALFPAKRQAGQTMWLVDQLTDRQRRRHTSGTPSADGQ